jgi:hypothetical protein
MRRLLSFSFLAAGAAAFGCGGVTGPAAPRMIPGGGVGDGAISGAVHVHVIDEESREVVSSAAVRVGASSDPAPCEELTASTGLASFQAGNCPGLNGPVTVTITAPGYTPVTWIGVNGTNMTIPVRSTNPAAVPTATVSGTISGWSDLPVPGAGHQTLALISYSGSNTLGDRANDLPQGTRNVRVGDLVIPIASNLCVRNALISDCNWTLTTRTGPQAHFALIVDQFDNNTPNDDTDDTFTVTSYALKRGVDLSAGATVNGEALEIISDADMQTFTASFASLPSGMDFMGAFPALELGDEGRIGLVVPALDMSRTSTRVPKLSGALAGARYSLIATAQDSATQDRPSTLAWMHDVNVASTVTLTSWLPPPSSLSAAAGTYSFSAVPGATIQGADLESAAGQRLWSISVFDGSTSFTLPGLSPDPLLSGTITFIANAMQIPNTDLKNFAIDDVRDRIVGMSADYVTFTH